MVETNKEAYSEEQVSAIQDVSDYSPDQDDYLMQLEWMYMHSVAPITSRVSKMY